MAVYCWGSTAHGELGLGGIEDEQIMVPRDMEWVESSKVIQAACGQSHTLFVTSLGKVYSCGINDQGQLGQEMSRKRPRMSKFQPITALDNYLITQIGSGYSHSLAINNWGQIFSWGSNQYGQLGLATDQSALSSPKIVKTLATKHVVQIACGLYHNLALTNSGELYAWGSNSQGQLGLGYTNDKIGTPMPIKSLTGIPFAFIACGGYHSFAISKSGAIFCWGKNTFGQLGLNDLNSRPFPTQLKTLRSLGVRYVACGDDFSAFLTYEGGVFTCGAGTFGQLGHGGCSNEIIPRMVIELMGSTITQISCGRRHTLAFVPSRGKVYGFGLGGSGQLGSGTPTNSNTPQVVKGPWVAPVIDKIATGNEIMPSVSIVKRIFSGGDQCFVSLCDKDESLVSDDLRNYDPATQILELSVGMSETLAAVEPNEQADLDLISSVEIIFKSQACMNGSLLLPNEGHICCTSKHHGVNMDNAEFLFDHIRKIEHGSLKQLIWDSISKELCSSLLPAPPDVETLRIYQILPLYHEFVNSKNFRELHVPFSAKVLNLQQVPNKIVSQWWAAQSKDYFERLVSNYMNVLWYMINKLPKMMKPGEEKPVLRLDQTIISVLDLITLLYRLNHTTRKVKVPYELFHLPEINEMFDVRMDYVRWLMEQNPHSFYFCNYPFLFDATAKMLLLQTDQSIQMHHAMQNAVSQGFFSFFTNNMLSADVCQYLVLNVTRENIVQDTIRELANYGPADLKKPLKIKFHGEEAEDAGGVRKEFFMLLLKDIVNPKYGMFKTFDDSRALWFTEDYFEEDNMFKLIGIICGLAIYNFTIIYLPFPLALYKKLLKEDVDLNDLKDLSPTLGNSMQSLLDYNEPDFSEVFDLTFELTRDFFGEKRNIQLKLNGDKIQVTLATKLEFVNLYIDYMLNKAVEKSFNDFRVGFMKVCGGRVLELFKSHELMAVVIGNEEYDWHVLEEEAEYKNGYKSSDETVRWFWEVFHELPLEEKKNFLLFLTGSDRIPVSGMKAIKIWIQPTTDDKFLPVAHTCFNLLDLPQYKTKERLKYKLLQAIQQTQGFSLV